MGIYLFNVDYFNSSFDCIVCQCQGVEVAGEYFECVCRDLYRSVAHVDSSWVVPIRDVDLTSARIVAEVHVIKDNAFVESWLKTFQTVDVAHEKCRSRRMRFCPGSFPTSRLSFEHKNPMLISVESKACQRFTHLSGNHSVFVNGEVVFTS